MDLAFDPIIVVFLRAFPEGSWLKLFYISFVAWEHYLPLFWLYPPGLDLMWVQTMLSSCLAASLGTAWGSVEYFWIACLSTSWWRLTQKEYQESGDVFFAASIFLSSNSSDTKVDLTVLRNHTRKKGNTRIQKIQSNKKPHENRLYWSWPKRKKGSIFVRLVWGKGVSQHLKNWN